MRIILPQRVTRRAYDESVFCETCLAVGSEPRIVAAIRRRLSYRDPSDVVMDFIVQMLETGRWRDYRPSMGSLKQMIVNWLMRYASWQTSNRHENRWRVLSLDADAGAQEVRETKGNDNTIRLRSNICRESVVYEASTSKTDVDSMERKVLNAVSVMTGDEDDAEALRVFIRTGSTEAVAGAMGVSRATARLALRRARKAAAKFSRFV